jgi:hypothetical protein
MRDISTKINDEEMEFIEEIDYCTDFHKGGTTKTTYWKVAGKHGDKIGRFHSMNKCREFAKDFGKKPKFRFLKDR